MMEREKLSCGSLAIADAQRQLRSVEYRHAVLRRAPTSCRAFLVRTLISALRSISKPQILRIKKKMNSPDLLQLNRRVPPPPPKGQRDKGLFVLKKHKSASKESSKVYKN